MPAVEWGGARSPVATTGRGISRRCGGGDRDGRGRGRRPGLRGVADGSLAAGGYDTATGAVGRVSGRGAWRTAGWWRGGAAGAPEGGAGRGGGGAAGGGGGAAPPGRG